MSEQIKPIETSYGGCRFRSRLEARYAVFFDQLKEPWEYEKEGYKLNSGCYLPDFWLPRLDCWLELKGQKPTLKEKKLCEELANATDKVAVLAWGLPELPIVHIKKTRSLEYAVTKGKLTVFCNDESGSAGWNEWDESFWAMDKKGKLCFCSNDDHHNRVFMTPYWNSFSGMKQIQDIKGPIDIRYVNLAKSARFEFSK